MAINALKAADADFLRKPIFYLEHPVGSGKTEAALQDISRRRDESFIYVCPTIELSDEIGARLKAMGRDDTHVLNTSTKPRVVRSVVAWVLNELRGKAPAEQRVYIVTTETFVEALADLDDWTKSQFHVFIDEGLDPVKPVKFSTKEMDIYRPCFAVDGDGKFSIADGYKGHIDNLVRNRRALDAEGLGHLDAGGFRDIAALICEPTYDVYGEITDKEINAIGFLNPQVLMPFASSTFIVAIFNQSVLALCLRELHHVDLRELELDFPFYDTHRESGKRMEIFYLLNEADTASISNLRKPVPGRAGQRVFERIAEIVAEKLKGKLYCWTTNKLFFEIGGVLSQDGHMPMKCHGLNAYRDRSAVAVLACANPTPWQRPILKEKLNCDDDELHALWNLSPVYQAIGRCSIRDRNSEADITVVVIGSREARELERLFEGAKLRGQLGDLPRVGKQDVGMRYTKADNTAYSKYKKFCKLNGKEPSEKDHWYREIRKPRLNVQG